LSKGEPPTQRMLTAGFCSSLKSTCIGVPEE
jgi:hypothetical protein